MGVRTKRISTALTVVAVATVVPRAAALRHDAANGLAREALFWGDVIHHPVQLARPDPALPFDFEFA